VAGLESPIVYFRGSILAALHHKETVVDLIHRRKVKVRNLL
jgi:hypothetical protein